MHASRVQNRILELIEEWRQTICQTSRYKDDLGFIRDMHRLLSYKGYIFPEVRKEDAAVLNPSDVSEKAVLDYMEILTAGRTFDPPRKWRQKNGKPNQPSSRNSSAAVDPRTCRRPTSL